MKQTITRYELELLGTLIDAEKCVRDAMRRLMLVEFFQENAELGFITGRVQDGAILENVLREYGIAVEDPLVEAGQGDKETGRQ
jgi:hypothetical protein